MPEHRRQARCCLLSVSPIANDPRVRRHGDALHMAGWEVTAVGLAASQGTVPDWPIRVVAMPPPGIGVVERLERVGRVLLTGRSGPLLGRFYRGFPAFHLFLAAASDLKANLYIANDWPVLPVAAALAERYGGRLIYDTHELATAEREENALWRLLYGRLAGAVERRFIHAADQVMTVSDGIARVLVEEYALPRLPVVVRNVPPYVAVPLRDPDPRAIQVLFQGLLAPGRGIEDLLRSVPLWRPEFRLVLRGPASDAYRAELQALVSSPGVQFRVTLEPPCPPHRMIELANLADIGVHPLDGINRNNRLAMPNKLFEYMAAGLALCVSDLPEMASVVRHHDCGRLIPDGGEKHLAETINGFTPESIAHYKRQSLAAAKILCWERERQAFLAACQL